MTYVNSAEDLLAIPDMKFRVDVEIVNWSFGHGVPSSSLPCIRDIISYANRITKLPLKFLVHLLSLREHGPLSFHTQTQSYTGVMSKQMAAGES